MNALFFLAAVICEAIAALLGFGVFSGAHILGWISLGVACLAAGFLVPVAVAWRHPGS